MEFGSSVFWENETVVIAVACEKESLYPVFRGTPEFTVFKIDCGIRKEREVVPVRREEGGAGRARLLAQLGVDLVICAGIDADSRAALADEGVLLVAGVRGEVERILAEYLAGELVFQQSF